MTKQALIALGCALLLGLIPGARAAVLNFDAPAQIDIDNTTQVATYPEAGFILSGQAASYLPLDGIGDGGSGGLFLLADSPLRFSAVGSSKFQLLGMVFGLLDVNDAGVLSVQGLRSDNSLLNQNLTLGALQAFSFQGWSELREVSFTANANVVLDNLNAQSLPEPGTAVLGLAAATGLLLTRRRKIG